LLYYLKMKKIFKPNILIPSNIKIFLKKSILFLKGPQGFVCLNIAFLKNSNLAIKEKRKNYFSFFRLFQKQLLGISLNFVIKLNLIGIGFRIESIENQIIKLKLGFSHQVFVIVPPYINVCAPKKTILILSSINEHFLKQFYSKLRLLKIPDIYKGKGILYKGQKLILKPGKKK
jgi:large subunit ribosomal protein L6